MFKITTTDELEQGELEQLDQIKNSDKKLLEDQKMNDISIAVEEQIQNKDKVADDETESKGDGAVREENVIFSFGYSSSTEDDDSSLSSSFTSSASSDTEDYDSVLSSSITSSSSSIAIESQSEDSTENILDNTDESDDYNAVEAYNSYKKLIDADIDAYTSQQPEPINKRLDLKMQRRYKYKRCESDTNISNNGAYNYFKVHIRRIKLRIWA